MRELLDKWVLQPQLLPAWLQSGAGIIALIISGFAVWRSESEARRRSHLERDSIAVAIFPEMEMLKDAVKQNNSRLDAIVAQCSSLVGQHVTAQVTTAARVEVPPMIDRYTDKLFLLGAPAGPSCIHLVRFLIQHNSTVDAITNRIIQMEANKWVQGVEQIKEHLAFIDALVATCQHHVKPIHDAVG